MGNGESAVNYMAVDMDSKVDLSSKIWEAPGQEGVTTLSTSLAVYMIDWGGGAVEKAGLLGVK